MKTVYRVCVIASVLFSAFCSVSFAEGNIVSIENSERLRELRGSDINVCDSGRKTEAFLRLNRSMRLISATGLLGGICSVDPSHRAAPGDRMISKQVRISLSPDTNQSCELMVRGPGREVVLLNLVCSYTE